MDTLLIGLGVLALLLGVLALGSWIFAGLVIVAMLSLWGLGDFGFERIGLILSKILFRAANSWELSAIPLFILMG
ncbi:C4-dicarboxylate ABC transporter permease, partial [Halomonas elongata]|nr:C4-dicarboxylate ABC transporter permease [Halomonas elongata]